LDPAANTGSLGGVVIPSGLETRWPVPGDNVILTLDIRLQLAAEQAMEGMRGAAVAINPVNGDVLALVSLPSFDLNRFPIGLSQADFRSLNSDPNKPLFNRALAGNYPPGSVIKPFLALAALGNGVLDADLRAMCPGYFQLPGHSHRYRDWKQQGHGMIDMHQAIVQSCDVYYYQLAVKLGIDAIDEYLRSFGFNSATGLDINGEARGVVPSREWKRSHFSRREDQVWFPGETVITGIGQGFTLVTPVQLAHATATLASRGAVYQPRLVMATEDGVTGERVMRNPNALTPVEIDDNYWQRIHFGMLGVTEETTGTARGSMRGTEYHVAGKTGTAQVFSVAQDEKYDAENLAEHLKDHGLFIAFAPAEEPTIAIAIVVENRGGGSVTAAPVARAMLDVYLEGAEYEPRQH
jgi:penicillin-binding protein 2